MFAEPYRLVSKPVGAPIGAPVQITMATTNEAVLSLDPSAGRTCGPVAPARTGGTHPLLQLVGDRHDTPRPAHRQNLPSLDFSQAAYRLPECQAGRMESVCNRERSRLSSGGRVPGFLSRPDSSRACLPHMSSPSDSGAWPAVQEQQRPSQVRSSRR